MRTHTGMLSTVDRYKDAYFMPRIALSSIHTDLKCLPCSTLQTGENGINLK